MSEELKLAVVGLDCAGCALDVETILLRMDGIISAKANSWKDNVLIEFDPKEVSENQILSVITGMKLKPVKL
jgi:copper chaperone CopZ